MMNGVRNCSYHEKDVHDVKSASEVGLFLARTTIHNESLETKKTYALQPMFSSRIRAPKIPIFENRFESLNSKKFNTKLRIEIVPEASELSLKCSMFTESSH